MSDENTEKYSFHVKKVEELLESIQKCEDVDDALHLFKEAKRHFDICKDKIESAKGEFAKLNS